MQVSFETSTEDARRIMAIVNRADQLGLVGGQYPRWTLAMDLSAVHANGCPIDFAAMLAADQVDLVHDICGIATHLDRKTGQLRDYFLPRFALGATLVDA